MERPVVTSTSYHSRKQASTDYSECLGLSRPLPSCSTIHALRAVRPATPWFVDDGVDHGEPVAKLLEYRAIATSRYQPRHRLVAPVKEDKLYGAESREPPNLTLFFSV